jgi:hypothetical protein
MKRIACLICGVACIYTLSAQGNTGGSASDHTRVIGRFSLISPKVIAEIAPSEIFTLTTGFWMRASFYEKNQEGVSVYHPSVSPSITLEPRYYFNLDEREAKGKRTDYFSGWYIGIPFAIEFPDLRYSLGTVIGFQCSMGKRWYWNISFGPGITFTDARFYLDGAGDFGLGLILNKME